MGRPYPGGRVASAGVEARGVAEVDRQALLTMLTTEHFTLQGSRSTTVSESSSRAALYMGSVSSTLIALGFIAQVSNIGDAFDVFALVALPTLFALGVFTFVRTVESSVEDVLYGRAINRIRAYYLQLAGDESRWFVMGGHDDALGVLANMGLQPSRWQLNFTVSMMVATVNSVVGGSVVALALGRLADVPLGVAAGAGAVTLVVSLALHRRWDRIIHMRGGGYEESLFPTP
jgi:hypothetical protein